MDKYEITKKFLDTLEEFEDKFFLHDHHPIGAVATVNFYESIFLGETKCVIKFDIEITKI